MKLGILAMSLCALVATSAARADVVVSPGNMDGWTFYITDTSVTYGAGDATAEMVNGPATPPLGTGSAHFNTGSDGFQSAQLRLSTWSGTAIADLTSLSYSTYATSWNGQQMPFLNLYLSNGDRLWFEPDYSSTDFGYAQPAPALNTWQTWDALGGEWYTDNGAAGSGPGSDAKSWAAIVAAEGAGVTIVPDGSGRGGIRLASGFASSGDSFNTYLDNFTIGTASGTTTYNFEAVPEPSSLALLGVGVLGLVGLMRRKSSR